MLFSESANHYFTFHTLQAISLAILVGTSVDYCVHLVEGYRIAGESHPPITWDGSIRGKMGWNLRRGHGGGVLRGDMGRGPQEGTWGGILRRDMGRGHGEGTWGGDMGRGHGKGT